MKQNSTYSKLKVQIDRQININKLSMKKAPQSIPFQTYLQQKPEPNLAIKLQPVSQQVKHTFICECQMCRQYAPNKCVEILNEKTIVLNQKIRQKVKQNGMVSVECFIEVLNKLQLPSHKVVKRGVDVFIPELCFFQDGQCRGLFMNKEIDDITIKKIHKNNVNPGLIQRIFNQRRRQHHQNLKKKLGINDRRPMGHNKSQRQKNKKELPVGGQDRDLVIIKYTDGFKSLITQTEFIMLTSRRKQDAIWKNIQIIKNNITVNDQMEDIVFVYYLKDKIKYLNLFERSKILPRIYAENIFPGQSLYISPEEEDQFASHLLNTNKKCFAEYFVYRIVSFIEYFYDEVITKLNLKVVIDEANKPFMMEVTSYRTKPLMKFTWTNDIYKKKLEEQYQKLLEGRNIQVTESLQRKSKPITGIMESKYSEMKNKYGITLEDPDNDEEVKNNNFWKKMHPEFDGVGLSTLLANQKNLSANGFMRKYMKNKEQKKPIVKDFSTHLIKVLHKTTPKIKISEFHQISFRPQETGLFSSRRNNQQVIPNRSTLSAITFYSKKLSHNESTLSPTKQTRKQSILAPTTLSLRNRRNKSSCRVFASPGDFQLVKGFQSFYK